MPYAPGNTYDAGRYFAAMGPQIAQNIQTYQKNAEERDQAQASAEMMGRYLKDDPAAVAMFGDKLQNIPKMSTGSAKALLGEGTMYITQRHLKAAEDAQAAQTDISKQELALRAGEAAQKMAERNRLASFNEQIGQEINPPLFFKSAAGAGPGPLTPDTFTRIAARAGVLGQPETTALFNAISTYNQRASGLPLGKEVTTPSGNTLLGTGLGQPPHVIVKTPDKGLDLGATKETPEGTWIGAGRTNEPKFLSNADKAAKPSQSDATFMQTAPSYAQHLDDFEKTVNKFGNFEWSNPAGAAALKQLSYQTGIDFSKIADPSSVAREGEVKAAQKYLIPVGPFEYNSTTKAAIKQAKDDLVYRVQTWQKDHPNQELQNLPDWLNQRLSAPAGSGAVATPAANRVGGGPSATVTVITPDGRRGNMPKDKLDEALKNGFKLAQ
jgi:hypothetical protein